MTDETNQELYSMKQLVNMIKETSEISQIVLNDVTTLEEFEKLKSIMFSRKTGIFPVIFRMLYDNKELSEAEAETIKSNWDYMYSKLDEILKKECV